MGKCAVGVGGRKLSGKPSGSVWSTRYPARKVAPSRAVDREDVRKEGSRGTNRVNQYGQLGALHDVPGKE